MKKSICTILVLVIMFVSTSNCIAKNKSNNEQYGGVALFSYCSSIEAHKNYAVDNFSSIMSLFEGEYEGIIELGDEITIFNCDGVEKTVFPVWNNDKLIADYLVVTKEDGEISGYLTEYYTYFLNKIVSKTSIETPLLLFSTGEGIFGKIGNVFYNAENGEIIEEYYNLDFLDQNGLNVSSCRIKYKGEVNQSKSSTTKPFTIYQRQTEDWYCLSYATYNILKNLGYNSYTLSQCKSPLNTYMGGGTPNIMRSWLTGQGFTAYSNNSGNLTIAQINSVLTTNHSYVCASAAYNTTSGHAFVIYGTNSTGYLYIWDVRSSSKTISSDLTHFPGSDSNTYVWNHGYYYLDIDWD